MNTPLSQEELTNRLLALNQADSYPKVVESGKDLYVIWNDVISSERKFLYLFRSRVLYKTKLRLVEKSHTVRVLEIRLSYLMITGLPFFSLSFNSSRSVDLFSFRYRKSFDIFKTENIKEPDIFVVNTQPIGGVIGEIIKESGWVARHDFWDPVILFSIIMAMIGLIGGLLALVLLY